MADRAIRFMFGAMEAALAEVHGIAPSKRTAFQARLKNFHRLNYPLGLETKKGKAAIYGPGLMVEMAVALEMTQLGLPPDRIVHVLVLNRFPTFMAIKMAAHALEANPLGFDELVEKPETDPLSMFLYFDPAALQPLMLDWDPAMTPDLDQTDDTFFYGGEGVVRDNLVKWTSGAMSRLSLINVTSLIDRLAGVPFPNDHARSIEYRQTFFQEVSRYAAAKVEETYEHEAEYFAGRLLERNYPPPADEEAEKYVVQLLKDTGLQAETIRRALARFASGERLIED